jgi:NAD(P)-dependent dehydrogenase (short-subunit alcohol dehydrogenase family)
MLLKDRVAVIYGAARVGGAVARQFASEGATVFVTGREWWPLELVAKEILAVGGYAEPSVVDAFDEEAVDKHLQSVIRYLGHVDISFNAVGLPDENDPGAPLIQMDAGQFSEPITADTMSGLLTARLAAKHMIVNQSGVIMTLSGLPARVSSPPNGGYGPTQAANEALTRDLSYELAPHGIRVIGLRLYGIPENDPMAEVFGIKGSPNDMSWDELEGYLSSTTHPNRTMTLDEVAKVAVFVASDRASGLSGTTVNLTMGTIDG